MIGHDCTVTYVYSHMCSRELQVEHSPRVGATRSHDIAPGPPQKCDMEYIMPTEV
jgi:hypothetical protein